MRLVHAHSRRRRASVALGVVAVVLPVALGLWLRADQQEREGTAEP